MQKVNFNNTQILNIKDKSENNIKINFHSLFFLGKIVTIQYFKYNSSNNTSTLNNINNNNINSLSNSPFLTYILYFIRINKNLKLKNIKLGMWFWIEKLYSLFHKDIWYINTNNYKLNSLKNNFKLFIYYLYSNHYILSNSLLKNISNLNSNYISISNYYYPYDYYSNNLSKFYNYYFIYNNFIFSSRVNINTNYKLKYTKKFKKFWKLRYSFRTKKFFKWYDKKYLAETKRSVKLKNLYYKKSTNSLANVFRSNFFVGLPKFQRRLHRFYQRKKIIKKKFYYFKFNSCLLHLIQNYKKFNKYDLASRKNWKQSFWFRKRIKLFNFKSYFSKNKITHKYKSNFKSKFNNFLNHIWEKNANVKKFNFKLFDNIFKNKNLFFSSKLLKLNRSVSKIFKNNDIKYLNNTFLNFDLNNYLFIKNFINNNNNVIFNNNVFNKNILSINSNINFEKFEKDTENDFRLNYIYLNKSFIFKNSNFNLSYWKAFNLKNNNLINNIKKDYIIFPKLNSIKDSASLKIAKKKKRWVLDPFKFEFLEFKTIQKNNNIKKFFYGKGLINYYNSKKDRLDRLNPAKDLTSAHPAFYNFRNNLTLSTKKSFRKILFTLDKNLVFNDFKNKDNSLIKWKKKLKLPNYFSLMKNNYSKSKLVYDSIKSMQKHTNRRAYRFAIKDHVIYLNDINTLLKSNNYNSIKLLYKKFSDYSNPNGWDKNINHKLLRNIVHKWCALKEDLNSVHLKKKSYINYKYSESVLFYLKAFNNKNNNKTFNFILKSFNFSNNNNILKKNIISRNSNNFINSKNFNFLSSGLYKKNIVNKLQTLYTRSKFIRSNLKFYKQTLNHKTSFNKLNIFLNKKDNYNSLFNYLNTNSFNTFKKKKLKKILKFFIFNSRKLIINNLNNNKLNKIRLDFIKTFIFDKSFVKPKSFKKHFKNKKNNKNNKKKYNSIKIKKKINAIKNNLFFKNSLFSNNLFFKEAYLNKYTLSNIYRFFKYSSNKSTKFKIIKNLLKNQTKFNLVNFKLKSRVNKNKIFNTTNIYKNTFGFNDYLMKNKNFINFFKFSKYLKLKSIQTNFLNNNNNTSKFIDLIKLRSNKRFSKSWLYFYNSNLKKKLFNLNNNRKFKISNIKKGIDKKIKNFFINLKNNKNFINSIRFNLLKHNKNNFIFINWGMNNMLRKNYYWYVKFFRYFLFFPSSSSNGFQIKKNHYLGLGKLTNYDIQNNSEGFLNNLRYLSDNYSFFSDSNLLYSNDYWGSNKFMYLSKNYFDDNKYSTYKSYYYSHLITYFFLYKRVIDEHKKIITEFRSKKKDIDSEKLLLIKQLDQQKEIGDHIITICKKKLLFQFNTPDYLINFDNNLNTLNIDNNLFNFFSEKLYDNNINENLKKFPYIIKNLLLNQKIKPIINLQYEDQRIDNLESAISYIDDLQFKLNIFPPIKNIEKDLEAEDAILEFINHLDPIILQNHQIEESESNYNNSLQQIYKNIIFDKGLNYYDILEDNEMTVLKDSFYSKNFITKYTSIFNNNFLPLLFNNVLNKKFKSILNNDLLLLNNNNTIKLDENKFVLKSLYECFATEKLILQSFRVYNNVFYLNKYAKLKLTYPKALIKDTKFNQNLFFNDKLYYKKIYHNLLSCYKHVFH